MKADTQPIAPAGSPVFIKLLFSISVSSDFDFNPPPNLKAEIAIEKVLLQSPSVSGHSFDQPHLKT